jgi:uncharacterized protein (DUF1330 family)
VKYYAIAEIDLIEHDWVRDYVDNVTPMVERRGGRFLARSAEITKVEGDRRSPLLFLIIEWPSREDAEMFYDSEEYRPYREARQQGTHGAFFLVAGEDVNGVARID